MHLFPIHRTHHHRRSTYMCPCAFSREWDGGYNGIYSLEIYNNPNPDITIIGEAKRLNHADYLIIMGHFDTKLTCNRWKESGHHGASWRQWQRPSTAKTQQDGNDDKISTVTARKPIFSQHPRVWAWRGPLTTSAARSPSVPHESHDAKFVNVSIEVLDGGLKV